MRQSRSSLTEQPGSFWLGAGLVAEIPATAAIALLPAELRERALQAVFTSWEGSLAALAVLVGLFLAVAWIGHWLGLGR